MLSGKTKIGLKKIGIIVFPGSNCDRDCYDAVEQYLGAQAVYLWHRDPDLKDVEAILLPGGFSYGDYLRSGAIARVSPIMQSVQDFAQQGRPVLGICNGFQVLTEAHLLPGALVRNQSMAFQCQRVRLTVETTRTPFTQTCQTGQLLDIPIAHADGNYYADADTLKQLEDRQQVVFRYVDEINGSLNRIAGVCNQTGNVVGLMPHPERALWPSQVNTDDGRWVFDSLAKALQAGLAVAAA